jgi:hypothetical protein
VAHEAAGSSGAEPGHAAAAIADDGSHSAGATAVAHATPAGELALTAGLNDVVVITALLSNDGSLGE